MPRASIWLNTLGSAFLLAGGAFAGVPAANAGAGSPQPSSTAVEDDKEMQVLLSRLTELSAQIVRNAASADVWRDQITQGDVLTQLAVRSKGSERDNWLRMAVDSYHSAMVSSPANENTAQSRLIQLGGEITRTYPGCPVAVYAYLQEIKADRLRLAERADGTSEKAKEYRCQRVERLVEAHPNLADSQGLLMEAAQDYEALGKKDDARRCYLYMAEHYPDSSLGQKAAGILIRIGMGGEPIRLKLPLLYAAPDAREKDFDLLSTHSPLMVVYFWMSKCSQADQDFRDLKLVTDRYHHQGVEVVFVNLDDDPAQARAFLSGRLTMGVHVHESGGLTSQVAQRHNLKSLPQAILLDKDGVLIESALRAGQIDAAVSARIQQMQHEKTGK